MHVTKGINVQQDRMGQVYKGAINLLETITLQFLKMNLVRYFRALQLLEVTTRIKRMTNKNYSSRENHVLWGSFKIILG